MQQWEFTYLESNNHASYMKEFVAEVNRLTARGWEPVGVAGVDKTVGVNKNGVVLKRPITDPPAPPATDDLWQADPTGRYTERRWEPRLRIWTAEVRDAQGKEKVDPPWA